MPNLIIINKPFYSNPSSLQEVIPKYIYRKAHTYGGMSVDPQNAVEEMHLVKRLWLQMDGCQLKHFVLSFDDNEAAAYISGASSLETIAYMICEYFADEYQVIFGVHKDSERGKWHIHFVINSVSYRTGRKYISNQRNDYALRDYAYGVLPYRPIGVYYTHGHDNI